MTEGLEHELGAEVRPTDADGDDARQGLPGDAGAGAGADLGGERLHAVEDAVHIGDHIHPIDHECLALGGPEGGVRHGPILGNVQVLACEHGPNLALEARGPAQLEELGHGFDGDTLAAVVKDDAVMLGLERDASVRVLRSREDQGPASEHW